MATYKVIQDIEAEDKILGPFTLRQFIYGLVAGLLGYVCVLSIMKGVPFLLIVFLPPTLFCALFAAPLGGNQSTEVWALAKIRFYFKPRRRIWDQIGIKELVTITVPKKVEQVLTNGLSQNEVESRLTALANTIDSRGWAVKNVNVNLYGQANALATVQSDRLIDPGSLPQEVPNFEVQATDDMLDETSNPIAQQFDTMINKSSQVHRQELIDEMNGLRQAEAAKAPAATNDYWFLNQPAVPGHLPANQAVFDATPVVHPGGEAAGGSSATADELALIERLKSQRPADQLYHAHMRTIQPLARQGAGGSSQSTVVGSSSASPSTDSTVQQDPQTTDNSLPAARAAAGSNRVDPAILSLANNNDLNVATLAREASKAKNAEPPADEVVISLH